MGLRIPSAVRRDPRFLGASPGAQYVYLQLCDRREVPVDPGRDLLGSVALVLVGLGDRPRDALAPILEELLARGLVALAEGCLAIAIPAAPDGRRGDPGPRGGLSPADRSARYRERKAAAKAGLPDPTKTSDASRDASRIQQTRDGFRDEATVTSRMNVTETVTGSGEKKEGFEVSPQTPLPSSQKENSQSAGAREEIPGAIEPTKQPAEASPKVEPPADASPEAAEQQSQRDLFGGAAAAQKSPEGEKQGKSTKGGKASRKRPAPAAPDPTPPPAGTLARRVFDAIVGDPALGPIVGAPADFARRVTADGAYPGVDVLAEVQRAGLHAARAHHPYTDGAKFLAGWLKREVGYAVRASALAPAPAPIPRGTPPRAPAVRPDARGRVPLAPVSDDFSQPEEDPADAYARELQEQREARLAAGGGR